jgi:hypothetical protein
MIEDDRLDSLAWNLQVKTTVKASSGYAGPFDSM